MASKSTEADVLMVYLIARRVRIITRTSKRSSTLELSAVVLIASERGYMSHMYAHKEISANDI